MGPEQWREKLGASAWAYVSAPPGFEAVDPETVAAILTRATEIGARMPTRAPQVDPRGTKMFWPGPGGGQAPSLTALGLLRHWEARGHGFLLLRLPILMHAVAGPLLARFQEILKAYEDQAEREGAEPLPIDWYPFVGGTRRAYHAQALHTNLEDASPDYPTGGTRQFFRSRGEVSADFTKWLDTDAGKIWLESPAGKAWKS